MSASVYGESEDGYGVRRDGRESYGALVVLGALLVGYAVLPLGDLTLRLWYDVTAVLAVITGFLGLATRRPTHPRGWVLLLAGLGGWVVGDVVWQIESWSRPAPFPGLSDAVYLSSYALLGAGVLAMVRTRRSGGDRAAFLDAAILAIGAAVVMTAFVIAPVTRDAHLGVSAKIVASAYPVGDVFLLATLARMVTSPGARNSSYRLLLAALVVTAVVDSLWNVLVAVSGDETADQRWFNVGWLTGYLLIVAAASRRAMVLVAEPAPPSDTFGIGRRRVVAMGVGLLLPAAALLSDGLDGDLATWPVIAAGSGVLSVLVLVRFVDLFSVVQTQAVQLAALARTDPLTAAANRRTWDHELSRAARSARDHGRRFAVAILDLDHFKNYNDTHGPPAGDELLRDAVAAWRAALPAPAVLARYGGEEFAILLPGHDLVQARWVIEALGAPHAARPDVLGRGRGVGRCRTGPGPETRAALGAAADKALYRAMGGGRNQVVAATAGDAGPGSADADRDPTLTARPR